MKTGCCPSSKSSTPNATSCRRSSIVPTPCASSARPWPTSSGRWAAGGKASSPPPWHGSSRNSALARFRPAREFPRARDFLVAVQPGERVRVEAFVEGLLVCGEPFHRQLAVVAVQPHAHQAPVGLLVV